jgi:hypothetical protein
MRSTPRIYDFAAAGLAAILSAVEVTRLILSRGVTEGHTMLSTLIGGIAFCAVLVAAAVGLALHRRIGWICGAIGALAAAAHGIIVRAGGNRIGAVYLLVSFLMLGLIIKSMHWYRTESTAQS